MIGWLDLEPPEDGRAIFEGKGYIVRQCVQSQLRDETYLAGLSAVVLTQSAIKPLKVSRDLFAHSSSLLNHDCRVIVRAAVPDSPIVVNSVKRVNNEQATAIPPTPCVRHFNPGVSWIEIGNVVEAWPQGRAANLSLRISVGAQNGVTPSLNPDAEVLIRRAFSDCSSVYLEVEHSGRSGATIYRAYAEMDSLLMGQSTQPYFVKFDERPSVLCEYNAYRQKVHPYVPFHLGPHLDYERCCLGEKKGLLVGNYVEESESFLRCAEEGRSTPAIACLFDRTLLAWRGLARCVSVPFSEPLLKRFPSKIDPRRFARASALGATKNIRELRSLFSLCKSEPVLVGPIHGDLHGKNIRVRATEAIVIDFASQENCPLLLDAATLEASLLVEGNFGDDNPECWLAALTPLYGARLLEIPTVPVNASSDWRWYCSSIQQIRGYAARWEQAADQYAAALALALLEKAKKDPEAEDRDASRRAVAYVLAERILVETFARQTA